MTYQDLIESVEAYLESSEEEFVDQIDRFVRLAEQRIYRTARLPSVRATTTVALSTGVATGSWPSDFLLPLSADIAGTPLLMKDKSYLKEAYGSSTGTPRIYANASETQVIVAPVPDGNYTMNLDYIRFPESIVDAQTSWLGDNAEEALLYGTLVEAYIFNKGEPDLLEQYKVKFAEAVSTLVADAGAADQDENLGTTVI